MALETVDCPQSNLLLNLRELRGAKNIMNAVSKWSKMYL